ncbi:MAG: TIGR02452 family protein [Planctomycetes bacterium]|nr:TIGR02452 family protein [Planctomycetota bacterium]
MKRSKRAELARQTVEIVERGSYRLADGRTSDIASAVESCLASTRVFAPENLERLRRDVLAQPAPNRTTEIEVRNETTLAGVSRLLAEGCQRVTALNFASAKNPGGGFLNGSQAQEESLARSSALYASLLRGREYYDRHRGLRSCLYSDAMILSPECPIFRNDAGELLEHPLAATFITSAAPNAGAAADNMPDDLPLIPETFRRRSEYVLALAASQGCENLILGAWGCGVFRNDPKIVAEAFAGHLHGSAWSGRFSRVVFSVSDASPAQEIYAAFQRAFAGEVSS